jgi:hypothetical protein
LQFQVFLRICREFSAPGKICNKVFRVIKYPPSIEEFNLADQGSPEQNKRKELLKPFWFLFTVGWYIILSLIIPTGIGYWLDQPQQFNSGPLYTIIGLALGTLIAFWGLARMMRQFYREQKQTWENKKKEPEE